MHYFDWDRVDTAHEYVKRGTKRMDKGKDYVGHGKNLKTDLSIVLII